MMNTMLKRFPSWLILLFGILLGSTLTSTLTFHLWWCEQRTLSLVRDSSSLLTPHISPPTPKRCICRQESLKASSKSVTQSSKLQDLGAESHGRAESNREVETREDNTRKSGGGGSCASGGGLNLNGSEAAKEGLVMAVLSTQGRVEWLEYVYETWGRDQKQLLMFIGDKFNGSRSSAHGLPLVQLKAEKNLMLSTMQYLADHYTTSNQWFMLATEDSYVRQDKLQALLTQLNPKEKFYLGRSAAGKKKDADWLGLRPHERYCLGSSGIVLSVGLVSELKDHLDMCASDADLPGDVALGKCISRVLDMQCTQDNESRTYFFEDYSGEAVTADYINKRSVFDLLVSYHPLPSRTSMLTLHQHYKHSQFSFLLDKLKAVQRQLSQVCGSFSSASPIPSDCSPSICPREGNGDTGPRSGVVSSLPSPYLPTTIYDFKSWIYFDALTIFPDQSTYPSYRLKMKRNVRQELKQVLTKAVQKINEHHGRPLRFKKLVNGWLRHDPFVGNQYIFDLQLVDGGRKIISKRIHLVRPLASNYITQKDSTDSETLINMIVPLTRVNQRFKEFMSMYEELALTTSEKVKLILSVYGQEDVKFVTNIVGKYRSKYPLAQISIMEGSGEFSRGRALHNAISHLASGELIFVCDVDMQVMFPFLNRCRRNTIQGKRVYYPEFFKLYNMDYVYWNQPHPRHVTVKRSHGHWAYYSFGMLCIYKSDYSNVGGMDTNIEGWGDEDVQFFNKVIRSRLEVLRAPDKGLSHRWHDKTCPKSLSPVQYKHCLSSQQENFADRKELAHYIQMKGVEIKGTGGVVELASNVTGESEDDQDDYSYG